MRCRGETCGREIEFLALPGPNGELRRVPVDKVDGRIRQWVTTADGRKVMVIVLHHSTCPNAEAFRRDGAALAGKG